jgi:hypothetical protein
VRRVAASARSPVCVHLIAVPSLACGCEGIRVRLDKRLFPGSGIRAVGGETAFRRERSLLGHASPENPPGLGPCGVSELFPSAEPFVGTFRWRPVTNKQHGNTLHS